VFCATQGVAQNLISNGDLEDTIPKNFDLKFAKGWDSPTNGSPDYLTKYHSIDFGAPDNANGYQRARSGIAYFGLVIILLDGKELREYVQTELNDTLEKDSIYCFQMYVSLADSMNYATRNSLGVYLSTNQTNSTTRINLPFIPALEVDSMYVTDKNNWVKVSGSFTANGNEKYLIIGNFNDASNTDTLPVEGGGFDQMYRAAYYYIDDVWLSHCDSVIGLPEIKLANQVSIYPNPTKENLFIRYEGNQKLEIKLFDLMGKEILQSRVSASLLD
jgi:hypothetical protein